MFYGKLYDLDNTIVYTKLIHLNNKLINDK